MILEKQIDKYFTKKIEFEIKNFLCVYDLDKKFVYNKNLFSLYIKKRKLENAYYILIFSMPYKESYKTLINIENVKKEIKKFIESEFLNYGNWNKWRIRKNI